MFSTQKITFIEKNKLAAFKILSWSNFFTVFKPIRNFNHEHNIIWNHLLNDIPSRVFSSRLSLMQNINSCLYQLKFLKKMLWFEWIFFNFFRNKKSRTIMCRISQRREWFVTSFKHFASDLLIFLKLSIFFKRPGLSISYLFFSFFLPLQYIHSNISDLISLRSKAGMNPKANSLFTQWSCNFVREREAKNEREHQFRNDKKKKTQKLRSFDDEKWNNKLLREWLGERSGGKKWE